MSYSELFHNDHLELEARSQDHQQQQHFYYTTPYTATAPPISSSVISLSSDATVTASEISSIVDLDADNLSPLTQQQQIERLSAELDIAINEKIEYKRQLDMLQCKYNYLQQQYHEMNQFNRIMTATECRPQYVYELIAHSYQGDYLYCWYRLFNRCVQNVDINTEWYCSSRNLVATARVIIFGCVHCKKVYRTDWHFISHAPYCMAHVNADDEADVDGVKTFLNMLENKEAYTCGEVHCKARSETLFELNDHMDGHEGQATAIDQFMFASCG